MGRLQASSPISFWENFRSPGVDMWSLFVGGDSKPPPLHLPHLLQSLDCRLLAGPTCGIQGCHESVLAQQKQGVHPLNPPASLGERKVAFGPRLAQYPPPGDAPRSLATNRLRSL
ncbi:hypothetical protein RB195_011856 [Necator americanus]|uniref:Uncharacterized protein n=1 Tax=Necator americanus TaxID=51031 RepID=A0ABR1D5Z4_NECAM